MRRTRAPRVGLIGPGRAGLALARALRRGGVAVLGVHGRRRKRVPPGIPLSLGWPPPWLERADAVLLSVRDDSLPELVAALTGVVRRGQVVLHLSGSRGSNVLAPLRRHGARVGSWHPLMTIPATRLPADLFRGAMFAVEGDAAAVRLGSRLARALGGTPVAVRSAVKPRYHAAAVFASNYIVTLLGIAEELMEAAGIGRRRARTALAPLARAAVENAARHGPARALTGPIVRGDAETVVANLRAMPDSMLEDLYASLCAKTIEYALSDRRAAKGVDRLVRNLERLEGVMGRKSGGKVVGKG